MWLDVPKADLRLGSEGLFQCAVGIACARFDISNSFAWRFLLRVWKCGLVRAFFRSGCAEAPSAFRLAAQWADGLVLLGRRTGVGSTGKGAFCPWDFSSGKKNPLVKFYALLISTTGVGCHGNAEWRAACGWVWLIVPVILRLWEWGALVRDLEVET